DTPLLRPADPEGPPPRPPLEPELRRIPARAALDPRQRRDLLARGDAREQRARLALAADAADRLGREHRAREERRRQERAPHLLEHDAELEEAEALAADGLGQVDALEPQLRRHLLPEGGVVARGKREHAAQLGRRRLLLEEAPQHGAELLLLVAEGEVQTRSFVRLRLTARRPRARLSVRRF